MAPADILAQFPRRRILVVGDVILDHYVRGTVSRTSPEAPVPILHVQEDEWLPGGAANVARNLTALGAKVHLVGLAGADEAGAQLRQLLKAEPRLTPHLIAEPGRPTSLKTRCVAQGQQMIRIDREISAPAQAKTIAKLRTTIAKLLKSVDGVILSDYGKGTLGGGFAAELIRMASSAKIKCLVDPKGTDYTKYRGAAVITPNLKEASEAANMALGDEKSIAAAAKKLHLMVKGEAVIITRGSAGVSVFPREGPATHHPARAREVFDVTGAGDTFISVLALALLSGESYSEAASLGNVAAGIVVGMAGVAVVTTPQLHAALRPAVPASKLRTPRELDQIVRSHRAAGRKVVFTNGFFDLLHHGHLRLLEKARKLGDLLVVAINSDAGTRRLKGSPRPILGEAERIEILSALPSVDHIVVFDEDTPEALLRRLRPAILAKGAPTDAVVGRDIVESHGGRVALIHLETDASIDSLIQRAKGRKP